MSVGTQFSILPQRVFLWDQHIIMMTEGIAPAEEMC